MNAISVRYEAILDGRDPEDVTAVATEIGREGLPLGRGSRALELVGLSIDEVAVRRAVV